MSDSLRARLLLWHISILALTIAVFGSTVCYLFWRSLLTDLDLTLRTRAEVVAQALRPAPSGTFDLELPADYTQDFLSPLAHRDLYVAVVSRCWETDTAALAAVLRQAPESLRYLGLMGSRRKIARVRGELAARNLDLSALGVELHAPIGLPLGGDSPGEIAISILAEVIGKRYEKSVVDS